MDGENLPPPGHTQQHLHSLTHGHLGSSRTGLEGKIRHQASQHFLNQSWGYSVHDKTENPIRKIQTWTHHKENQPAILE